MAEIKYTVAGFLKNLTYLAEMPQFFESYENKFVLAESVEVILKEEIVINPNPSIESPIKVSDDGIKITITYKGSRYWNKGKLSSPPGPEEVYSSLRFLMTRAVNEDNERANKLNKK